MTKAADLAAWLEDTRDWTDRALRTLVPPATTFPERIFEAMHYALFGGGKRIRPALVRLVARQLGGDDASAERPAVALELVHTYSLVHDDLPCMDDDELRRGRPTVHVAYDEATAVLVGDALQALAFELLAGAPRHAAELVRTLASAAGPIGMVGGQVLDLSIELSLERHGRAADLDAIRDMHARKTAALFAAAAEMGALAAGVTDARRDAARDFGRALGLAFQAVDDLLDVTGDASTLGKTPGKDAALERATLATAVGLETGRGIAEELAREARAAAAAFGASEGDLAVRIVDFVLERSA